MKPKSTAVKMEDYFRLPATSLKGYFGRVVTGQPNEYRTTFYRDLTPQEVLALWEPHLHAIHSKWPSLFVYESDLAQKVGPLSVMKPLVDRLSDIWNYYEDVASPSEPLSDASIAAVLKEWHAVRGMNLRSQKDTVLRMKKSTNSGSPFFTKRRTVEALTFPASIHYKYGDSRNIVQMLPAGSWNSVAVLGWRGQEGGPTADDVKQRVVWMFPFAVNAAELQVYQPLIELAQRNDLVPAWVSMERVDKEITLLFDTKRPQDDIICTDFTKFDQHFGPACQDAALQLLTGLLSTGSVSVQNWLSNVFPIKYNIPMMYNYGHIYSGLHGMGSGSGGTNVDETLVHRALQYEAAYLMGSHLNPHSQCLGDDGVLSFPGIETKYLVNSYTRHGLEMNESKQSVSKEDCTYLRRWHHINYRENGVCVGVYTTNRAIGRLCEQERLYSGWGPEMVALRQLSIIENCKYHPLFDEFVDFCMEGDRYRLGIDLPGFLDNIELLVLKAIETMPDFRSYVQNVTESKDATRGIADWRVIKHLKSLA